MDFIIESLKELCPDLKGAWSVNGEIGGPSFAIFYYENGAVVKDVALPSTEKIAEISKKFQLQYLIDKKISKIKPVRNQLCCIEYKGCKIDKDSIGMVAYLAAYLSDSETRKWMNQKGERIELTKEDYLCILNTFERKDNQVFDKYSEIIQQIKSISAIEELRNYEEDFVV